MNKYKIAYLLTIIFLKVSFAFAQQVTFDWKHIITGSGYTNLNCMAADTAGNMYVGGRLQNTVTFIDTTVYNQYETAFLAKFTPDGQMEWFKQFRYGMTVYSICFDSENKLYIQASFYNHVTINDTTLYTNNTDTVNFLGMFIAKFNTDGSLVWAKQTGGTFYYEGDYGKLKQMTIDKNDDIVLVGSCIEEIQFFDTTVAYTSLDSEWVTQPNPHWNYVHNTTGYLAKYNKDGQKLWIKNLGMQQQHYMAITTDYSNNILMTGYFWQGYPFTLDTITLTANGSQSIFIAKYNPVGKVIWAQRAGGSSNNNFSSDIIADSLNNIFLTGEIHGNNIKFNETTYLNFSDDAFLVKYDSSGIVKWFIPIGTSHITGYSVTNSGQSIFISHNDIYLSGFFRDTINLGFTHLNSMQYSSAFILKFDFSGNILNAGLDNEGVNFWSSTISLDKNQNILLAGKMSGTMIFGKILSSSLVNNVYALISENKFEIYPNPCKEKFNIKNDFDNLPYSVEIFDIFGRNVYNKMIFVSAETIDVTTLQKGIYFLKFSKSKYLFTKRLIIQ